MILGMGMNYEEDYFPILRTIASQDTSRTEQNKAL